MARPKKESHCTADSCIWSKSPIMELLMMIRVTEEPVNATCHSIAQNKTEGHIFHALSGCRQHG